MALPDARLVQGQIQLRPAPGPDGKMIGAKNGPAAISVQELKLDHG
jgi:hypothetical protein